ncbi:MAG TPA: hypothetical protein VH393_01280 [Ktedonobacterales bacterium]
MAQQFRAMQELLLRLLHATDGELDQILRESAAQGDGSVSTEPSELRGHLANDVFALEHYAHLLRDRLGIPISGAFTFEYHDEPSEADS